MVFRTVLTIILMALSVNVLAESNYKQVQAVRDALQEMVEVNAEYEKSFANKVSDDSLVEQTPLKTVVLCSDSRVAIRAFVRDPENYVFSIRDIGNQITTAKGSVTYGVEYLKTPVLLVVGHSQCGAVKTAMQGYSPKDPALAAELSSIHTDPKLSLNENIVSNVNSQVSYALERYQSKVDSGELVILGMVYDLHNDFGFGNGKLILVNVDGATDLQDKNNPYIKGINGINILNNNYAKQRKN